MSHVADQVARALARLPVQSQGRTNMEAVLTAFCQPFQVVEDVAYSVLTERGIDTGVGVQLDAIGKIVGQARGGLDDATYRRYLAGAVARNRSRGTTDEILNIAALVLDDSSAVLTLQNSGPATVVLQITGTVVSAAVAALLSTYFLTRAVAAGVRILSESSAADTWAHVAHFDVSHFDDANAVFTAQIDS